MAPGDTTNKPLPIPAHNIVIQGLDAEQIQDFLDNLLVRLTDGRASSLSITNNPIGFLIDAISNGGGSSSAFYLRDWGVNEDVTLSVSGYYNESTIEPDGKSKVGKSKSRIKEWDGNSSAQEENGIQGEKGGAGGSLNRSRQSSVGNKIGTTEMVSSAESENLYKADFTFIISVQIAYNGPVDLNRVKMGQFALHLSGTFSTPADIKIPKKKKK
jgi:hypothetical protein